MQKNAVSWDELLTAIHIAGCLIEEAQLAVEEALLLDKRRSDTWNQVLSWQAHEADVKQILEVLVAVRDQGYGGEHAKDDSEAA